MKKSPSNKQKLIHYLKSHDLMMLATQGSRPNAATVYYGIDDDFNLYIVTSPATEHGRNILKNNKIAAVIINTNQPMFNTKHKIGVQLYGTVHLVTKQDEVRRALSIWAKGKNETVDLFMENIAKNIWDSRPFVIRPSEIKWFNEELYGEEGTEIFKF